MIVSRLALIGCGAIAETSHAPAIRALDRVEVVGLFDPDQRRVEALQALLPGAKRIQSIAQAAEYGAEAVIIASPTAYHEAQTIEALEAGLHVLVEKPIAGTVEEAQRMAEAARKAGKLLAVGLFRRFFPAAKAMRHAVQSQALGEPLRYDFAEGGLFNWPATSASFFQKSHAYGGVLHDLGVHVLDLVVWWFGEPESVRYWDDAAGGLETNCTLELRHACGLEGRIRLSRDWATSNRCHVRCERGWLGWRSGEANLLEVSLGENGPPMRAQVCEPVDHWGHPAPGAPGLSYSQCFTAQLASFVDAIRGLRTPEVAAEEALRSLRIIEACYAQRSQEVGP